MPKTRLLKERFWEKVDVRGLDDCWEWLAYKNSGGYGTIGKGPRSREMLYAHHVAWILHNGPIPKGIFVLHHCDNPGCMNPSHLFLGTQADNIHDMYMKGRENRGDRARGEVNGYAKLSARDVHEIRCFLKAGYTQKEIAKGYGVNQVTISCISTGKTWGWLREEERIKEE